MTDPTSPFDPVAEVFDAVADTYDNVGVEFFRPIAHGLVRELAPRPGERALDVGCGRGAVLFPLAEAVAPGGTVTGIDLAPLMVAATAADVAAAAFDPDHVTVEVRQGDATAPDVAPGSVDLIASSLVLFFLPDPRAALAAWRRCRCRCRRSAGHPVAPRRHRPGAQTLRPLGPARSRSPG